MFLSCGDSLYDLFLEDVGTDGRQLQLNGSIGGSPMNVAVGLARLGHPSHFFTRLSSDPFGQRMRAWLQDSGVDLSLSVATDQNTTLAVIDLRQDGSADYVFYTNGTADVSMLESDLPATLPDSVRVLHFGSYSTAAAPTSDTLLSLARRESSQRVISYDPNLRPTVVTDPDRWKAMFDGFASEATVIKASDEDIATLFGEHHEEQFVTTCFDHGAELVFITRGANGGSAHDRSGRRADAGGVKVDVVDTVGAGDTFQAAILHWLGVEGHVDNGPSLQGTVDLEACLKMAIRTAAITCGRKGADMPWRKDIES